MKQPSPFREAACRLLAVALLSLPAPFMAVAQAADTPYAAKVQEAVHDLGDQLGHLGKAHAETDQLFFGATKINGDTAVVDGVKTRHGCSATVFSRKGDSFVRVSTNVMRDGQRALGSPLDPSGPAYAALSHGKAYHGLVDILGRMFDADYEPVMGGKGEVIGAYYVGFALE